MKKIQQLLSGILIAFTIVFVDRLFKLAALSCFIERCRVLPYLSFKLAFNRGFSWSLFHSTNDITFYIVTSLVILLTTIIFLYALRLVTTKKSIMGPVFIIAGSIGNIIDRIQYRAVIDFIVFSYKKWAWPSFNVADIFIVIGVILMILETLDD